MYQPNEGPNPTATGSCPKCEGGHLEQDREPGGTVWGWCLDCDAIWMTLPDGQWYLAKHPRQVVERFASLI